MTYLVYLNLVIKVMIKYSSFVLLAPAASLFSSVSFTTTVFNNFHPIFVFWRFELTYDNRQQKIDATNSSINFVGAVVVVYG